MTSTPAGWYPTPEGRLRYWDGARWTEHVAPVPPRLPVVPTDAAVPRAALPVGKPTPGPVVWIGWGGLVVSALLGLASAGLGGLFSSTGVYVLAVAVVALVRGHVDWARIRGRAGAGVALGAAITLFIVGGATATPTEPPPVAGSSEPSAPAPSAATPTSSTSTSPRPTPTPTPSPTTTTPSPQTARKGTALGAVAALQVKGRAPMTGYARDEFGPAWNDVDRNGCDTRNDVLRRDLKDFTLKAGTNGCLVLSGTLVSPYSADTLEFVRGTTTSSAVQVDHVVALSDAWQKGAQRLSLSSRTAFANDPLNLLAVDRATNSAKGDGDAATWLPPNKGYRCAYVARQVAVKLKYHLWATAAERDAIVRILQTCPAQELPSSKPIPLGGGRVVTVAPKPEPPQPTKTTSTLDPRFGTCGEANDAGYGPYVSGKDPEYDWYRDRDHDGIVCER
jgi:Protein of unknown function (DUF1524)/Excalibur calcium-binding domain/Protein of unknown function (DUF2510)